jgi:hypothetical protein
MFGRPLWGIYQKGEWFVARQFALSKLLQSNTFDGRNEQHAFAVIAARISLDPCIEPKSTEFALEAVDSHLRILTGTKIQSGVFTTTTPSEPIVSEAVANLLVKTGDGATGFGNWTSSITTMADPLIQGGFVNKGSKGELYARLMCVLARDRILAEEKSEGPFPYAQPFSASTFMQALFSQAWVDSLATASGPSTRSKGKDEEEKSFRETFKDGLMNFTHFAYTDDSLPPSLGKMQKLLHYLMYSQAALQLCPNQKDWDLLIPIYFGDRDDSFDSSKLSAMVVQVKNSKRENRISTRTISTDFSGTNSQPIIYLLLDLGLEKNSFTYQVEFVENRPIVHCIHAIGHNASTFGCQKSGMGLEAACALLFKHWMPRSALAQAIQEGNFVITSGFGKPEELLDACREPDVEMADAGESSEEEQHGLSGDE